MSIGLPEIPQGDPGDDLYPEDEETQNKIRAWVDKAFMQSSMAKSGHEERWRQYYKMYRSYVKKRPKGDWRSRVWMPIAFYVIESITPRLVAQLPEPLVKPVGPEDVQGADYMEQLLKWSTDQSDLYVELVKALKSALLYGTGILKTSFQERKAYTVSQEPEMMDQQAEVPTGETDIDGNPITRLISVGATPTGQMVTTRKQFVSYAGPVAEAVDITDFFIDPAADSIENARYVIHRVYRDKTHIEDFFQRGIYKKPDDGTWNQIVSEHASLSRQALIGLGVGPAQDTNLIQLLEVWTDELIIVVVGGGGGDLGGTQTTALLRVERNPYAHAEKPFVRVIDHLVPHEFWGIGELEPLEGLQDLLNKLWNNRIDNVKLVLNTMFLAVTDYVTDQSDLQMRPGGIIRVREGVPLDQAVKPLELGEVTSSSYTEAQEIERMTEKVSGVSPYTTGNEGTQAYNRTATGVALISEQGNTRFSHKIKMNELLGFKRLFRQFGQLLQQYAPPDMVLRVQGPIGQFFFQQMQPGSINGRFDYDVEAESSAQTESIRREQALSLFQLLAADPYIKPLKIREDILKVFDRKAVFEYLYSEQELMMMQQQAQQQASASQNGQQQAPAQEEQQYQ